VKEHVCKTEPLSKTDRIWISLKNACAPLHALKPCFMPSYTHARSLPSSVWSAHFLPLFLMPWLPVFKGPLPPAFLASSSRAFLSVANRQRLPAASCLHTMSQHNIPAAALSLKALSSSSSSTTFFLGFLLWMGLVPAGEFGQRCLGLSRGIARGRDLQPCPEGMLADCVLERVCL